MPPYLLLQIADFKSSDGALCVFRIKKDRISRVSVMVEKEEGTPYIQREEELSWLNW